MTEVVPSSALSEVSLRLLCHDDIDTVKHLCGDWFPIEYPDSWYRDITSNKKFFSLAATYRGAIVGMIVAEIKSRTKIHKEDGDILASTFSVDTQVAYILSLGVVKEFRKHGIGSLLLESLKDHISTTAQDHCKAIYLHVLTTNNTAINFYENRDFKQHHYLPYYYSIRGVLKDGFTYVLYINGGHPPWTILYPLLLKEQITVNWSDGRPLPSKGLMLAAQKTHKEGENSRWLLAAPGSRPPFPKACDPELHPSPAPSSLTLSGPRAEGGRPGDRRHPDRGCGPRYPEGNRARSELSEDRIYPCIQGWPRGSSSLSQG
ncbi:N-alpha-acetyltransferase 60 isoform X1 [Vulpes lagopus]|uniref:N-alpha-acetyltransferase 60 isoform X1 n=1 Tax=Vulpes lagopus TaxID=494514 RepID=UPI001BC970D6|nr:N-alpha-acetyltransferase 60 isoform X1 [Vulpes lagopus]XP_041605298.1 N-alpha-acetyltransferase 60 isoform X1 [Vulpes lagopus]